ncbi:MAG: nucleotidyl transferase AbiEii/AbiGii toxin family protein [Sedimentisphaerales bacterium]|nr:nucleotidyl transferase AbiEii/AbiGii toxin family protein [Sedimentisphaerales bacterium]
MDKRLIEQLAELAESFNRIGLKPVICGGLGIYLCFHKTEGQARQMIRVTTDIDLMLTNTQVSKEAERRAIAETITDGLGYVVREGCEYYQFIKEPNQDLDILSPPVEGLEVENFRVKIVKSKLHGHITPEACFIEEGLRTISLRELMPDSVESSSLEVQVPSPTNLLLLKLFAFNDRDEGPRQDLERAQAHVWDVYVTIMLTNREDYLEGQQFISRHEDSDIIQTARSIVSNKFSAIEQAGWHRVLESSDFYPSLNRRDKEVMLDEARRRLIRWFDTEHR